jgi:hypothetical protein
VLEKSDEHEFLFGIEVVTDPELLICVVGIHCNRLVFCFQGSLQLIVHHLIGGCWSRGRYNIGAFRRWRDLWRVADRWLGC